MGSIGARTGFNSYLLVRLAFGDAGARVVNLAFAISLLGWFGINLNLFGLAIAGLSDELFGIIPPELLVTIVASLLITVTTIIGFRAINLVSTLMIPVLAFVAMALLVTATSQTAVVIAASQGEMSLGDGISAIVGSIVIGSIIMPDITRFLRTSGGALLTSGTSYMIAQPFVMWVAASAAMVLGTEDRRSPLLRHPGSWRYDLPPARWCPARRHRRDRRVRRHPRRAAGVRRRQPRRRHDRPVDGRLDRRAARRPWRTRCDRPGLRQAGRGRRRPVGRPHPRVGHRHAAARRQLRRAACPSPLGGTAAR
ncbi:MAG: hypothetical protein EBY44_03220 [Actinobacteria bacterium]|nr:hypothetical protein [Actinomycetota bacterium]